MEQGHSYILDPLKSAKLKISGQVTRRHPETPTYRCCLSALAGFAGLRRAGPTRTMGGYSMWMGLSTPYTTTLYTNINTSQEIDIYFI